MVETKVIPCLETYKYLVQIYRSQDTNTVLVSTIFRIFFVVHDLQALTWKDWLG